MPKAYLPFIALIFTLSCAHSNQKAQNQIISIALFDDAINHYRSKKTKYDTFELFDFNSIADNIILLQKENGGWEVNQDPTKIFNQDEKNNIIAYKNSINTSFDNRNIYSQIHYLMEAFEKLKLEKYKNSAIKGINFTIKNQYENCGGWPHSLPPSQSYHDKITIADEVMSGNLRNLRKIAFSKYPYKNLPQEVKNQAMIALQKGDDCLLKLQIKQNGTLTGWAGQYDKTTLAPSMGRKFELPSIVSQETVEILRYLMEIENPSKEQIEAIENGIKWLQKSAIKGQKLEEFKLDKKLEFQYHNIDFDRRLVNSETAPPLWARFYDLNDNSIILANRDSIRVSSYDKIDIERRTGYSWYGYWPQKLLDKEYPLWRFKNKR